MLSEYINVFGDGSPNLSVGSNGYVASVVTSGAGRVKGSVGLYFPPWGERTYTEQSFLAQVPYNCGLVEWVNLPWHLSKEDIEVAIRIVASCGYTYLRCSVVEPGQRVVLQASGFRDIGSFTNARSGSLVWMMGMNLSSRREMCSFYNGEESYDDPDDDY
jgi:hypothetical protein